MNPASSASDIEGANQRCFRNWFTVRHKKRPLNFVFAQILYQVCRYCTMKPTYRPFHQPKEQKSSISFQKHLDPAFSRTSQGSEYKLRLSGDQLEPCLKFIDLKYPEAIMKQIFCCDTQGCDCSKCSYMTADMKKAPNTRLTCNK